MLATALADVIEEEKQNPCDVHEKLRRYVKDGTEDTDVRWALDMIADAASKHQRCGLSEYAECLGWCWPPRSGLNNNKAKETDR